MEFLGIFGQSVVEEVNEEADQASAMSIEKRAELMAPEGQRRIAEPVRHGPRRRAHGGADGDGESGFRR